MHLNSAQAQKLSPVIWILVADGGRAQIYRYHRNKAVMPIHEPQTHSGGREKEPHELTPVADMAFTAEPRDDFQISHDGRGSLIGGQNAAHNSCEPHLDIQDEIKQNLAVAVVAKLKQACHENAFDQLVVAASPQILGLLRQHLPAEVTARVLAEIPKDLTHYPTAILLSHLQDTLTEARVA